MAQYSLGVPDALDTTFDAVPKIRPPKFTARLALPRAAAPMPTAPALGSVESPIGTNYATAARQPNPPQPLPQPTPPPAPIPAPTPAQPPADPSLNFEGSTFQPTTSPTTTSPSPNEYKVDELLNSLESFSGLQIDSKWRDLARTNPEELFRQVQGIIDHAKQYGVTSSQGTNRPDTSFRQRLDGWFAAFKSAVSETSTAANPAFDREALQQQAFNQGKERLTQQLGYNARDDEEQLLAMLADRGLLNSGIASRELSRFQLSRTQNYNNSLSKLNEMLTSGQLDYIGQEGLARLQASLQFMNESELAKLRAKLEKDSQPSPGAQIGGAVLGSLPALLSRKKPTLGTGDGIGGYPTSEPSIYRNT